MGNDSCKQVTTAEWRAYLEESRVKFEKSNKDTADDDIQRPVGEYRIEDLDFYQSLGCGAFARVFLVQHKQTKEVAALKMLNRRKIVEQNQTQHVKNERKLLSQMRLPFIVQLRFAFQTRTYLCLGLEYVAGGEFFQLLREKRCLSEAQTRFYGSQVVLALEYLHNLDIIYRDLKPENIFVDASGYLKVGDFGFAKLVKRYTYTMCGTPEYIAPEILLYKGYGKAVDWWAFGVLLYEMLCGFSAFYAEHVTAIYEKILEAKVRFPTQCRLSRDARDLIKRLLERDLSKRFGNLHSGVADIREHPWFASFNWLAVYKGEVTPPFRIKVPPMRRLDSLKEAIIMKENAPIHQFPATTSASATV